MIEPVELISSRGRTQLPALTTRHLAVAICFLGIFAMASRNSVDSDTWWHLRAGAWMIENKAILNQDVFTSTVNGRLWDYPAWLTQILMYGLYQGLGTVGLNVMTALLVTIAFVFVYRTCEGGTYTRVACVLLAAATSAIFWSARPHLITLVFGAVELYILRRFIRDGVNWLWLLPVIMTFWGNMHPGFAVGFIFLGVVFGGELVKTIFSNQKNRWHIPLWLGAAGLLCAVALLISPYGIGQWLFPFKTVSIEFLQNHIQEWQSPDFHSRQVQLFLVLILAVFGSVGFSNRRLDLTDFLLLAVTITMALLAGRNIALVCLVSAPVLSRHITLAITPLLERNSTFGGVQASAPGRNFVVLNWALLTLIVIAVLLQAVVSMAPNVAALAIRKSMPVGAANYILQTRPQGLIFNSYNWGGYLIWKLYPDYLVYVDGRTDLYSDEFFNEFIVLLTAGDGWQDILETRGINLILIESQSPLAMAASRDTGWRLAYSDPVAVVYLRNP